MAAHKEARAVVAGVPKSYTVLEGAPSARLVSHARIQTQTQGSVVLCKFPPTVHMGCTVSVETQGKIGATLC